VEGNAVGVLRVMSGLAWKSWKKWQRQGKWMWPYFLSDMYGRLKAGCHYRSAL